MEWVEVTAKSVESAKELALDRLGIGAEEAEFEVVEEPRTGLFGRTRGEARVRARVRPTMVRQKQERRGRRKGERGTADASASPPPAAAAAVPSSSAARRVSSDGGEGRQRRRGSTADGTPSRSGEGSRQGGMVDDDNVDGHGGRGDGEQVAVEEVRAAAERFASGLVSAFGMQGTTAAVAEGSEIDVRIEAAGDGLGLLIGPSGRTLLAIQDLARVAAQRRLGDHETRLRVDVAGYREKRRIALERFAQEVADVVKESGVARSLEPMPSSDRKVVHDMLATIDGVVSRSEGEDPHRRIIVSPG